jgi:hypothetical protein
VTYEGGDPALLERLVEVADYLEVAPDSIAISTGDGLRNRREILDEWRAAAEKVEIVAHGVGLSICSASGWNEVYLRLVDELAGAVPVAPFLLENIARMLPDPGRITPAGLQPLHPARLAPERPHQASRPGPHDDTGAHRCPAVRRAAPPGMVPGNPGSPAGQTPCVPAGPGRRGTADPDDVLKIMPGAPPEAAGQLRELDAVLARLRDRGYPAPRFGSIGHVPGLVFWVQSRLPGAVLDRGQREPDHAALALLLPALFRLNDAQACLGTGPRRWRSLITQTLTSGGDGYCLHSTLQASPEARDMLPVLTFGPRTPSPRFYGSLAISRAREARAR